MVSMRDSIFVKYRRALLVKDLALRLFGWSDALHIFYVLYSYMRPLSDNYKDTGYSKIPLG